VSSDVVFDGVAPVARVEDGPHPVTAYGHAKLAAERGIAGARGATIVRVAMVYGWSRPGNSFAERVLHSLGETRAVDAPVDQFVSPVYDDDVAETVAAAVLRPNAPRLIHLGGPERLSRYRFALEAARALGAPVDLVLPVRREGTARALRPKHSCLETSWIPPELHRRGLITPAEGLRLTVDRRTRAVSPS
jgi:dTDP-4-dehydrorhamnose reductase